MNELRKLSKKFISVLFASLMLISTSCAHKSARMGNAGSYRLYFADKIDIDSDISSVTKLADNTYLLSASFDSSTYFFITDDTFILTEKIVFPEDYGDIREFCCTSDSEGNGYVLAEYEGEKKCFALHTISPYGKIKDSRYLDSISALAAENEFFYIKSVSRCSDGSFCLDTLEGLYLLDPESGKIESVNGQQKGIGYLLNTDEELYYFCNGDKTSECLIETEKNIVSNERRSFDVTLVAAPFYDRKQDSIYLPLISGIDMVSSNGSVSHILKWSDTEISASEIRSCFIGDNDDIYIFTKNALVYRLSETNGNAPARKEISLYLMCSDSRFEQIAVAFNKAQNEYRVTCSGPENTEDTNKETDLLIASGSYPDIFVGSDNEHFHILEQKGLFTDLYSLMDDELKKEDILPNIRTMIETNGKLYSLPLFFSVMTCSANASTGLSEDISNDELMEYYHAHNNIHLVKTDEDRMDVFGLFRYTIDDFIDRSSTSCGFESPEFVELLDFCSSFPAIKQNRGMDSSYDPVEELSAVRSGKILFKESFLFNISEFSMIQKKYFGSDIVLTGFPSVKGCGACAKLSDMMGITENSGIKEGAWEFMKFILLSEEQERYYGNAGMAVIENIFQAQCLDAQKPPHYYDLLGNKIYNDVEYTEVIGGDEIVIPPLTKKETERMSAYMRSVSRRMIDSPEIDAIIMEEISSFLNDLQTKEQCAAKIQSRLSLYLSEQY